MRIRGAGRIAREAVKALNVFGQGLDVQDPDKYMRIIKFAARELVGTRPTAVSLPNGIRYVLNKLLRDYDGGVRDVELLRRRLDRYSREFIKISLEAVRKIGRYGAGRIEDGDVILTHCNSSAALEVIKTAYRLGRQISVVVTETRPRYQGRLSAKILDKEGIKVTLIVDSAVRYFINDVDKVVVGADAIAANGAVVNKIGTSMIALAAHEARVPFMVAAESYKFSPDTLFGKLVTIEERDVGEVVPRGWMDRMRNVVVRNPAFDVTPPEYIDLIITEFGIYSPSVFPILIREHFGVIYTESEPWEDS
jgi:ribose 1,5-bisphosphate isomerase